MKRKRLADMPTATAVIAAEQDIVATAMSYTAAREKVNSAKPGKWRKAIELEEEFEDLLFAHCRQLRRLLKELGRAGKKRRK